MSHRKTFLVLLLVLLSAAAFYVTVSRVPSIKAELTFLIQRETGIMIDVSRISVRVFPQPTLILKDFDVSVIPGVHASIHRLELVMDFSDFLNSRIAVKQVLIQEPDIRIGSNRFLPAQSGISSDSADKPMVKLPTAFFGRVDKTRIDIENACLTFDHPTDSALLYSTRWKRIQCLLEARSEQDITLRLDGKDLTISIRDNASIVDIPAVNAVFSIKESDIRLTVMPFDLNHPKANIAVDYRTDGTSDHSELQIVGRGIQVEQAAETSLTVFKGSSVADTLFHILQSGFVPEVTVDFRTDGNRKLLDGNRMTLSGTIHQADVNIPKTPLKATNVTGSATVRDGILKIGATHAEIETSVLKSGDLRIDLLNAENVPFEGEFDLDADLSMVPKTLISLLPDTTLADEMTRVHEIKGRSEIRLGLSMSRNLADLKVRVETEPFGVEGLYDRLPGRIALDRVSFRYQDDAIQLQQIQGAWNGIRVHDLDVHVDVGRAESFMIRSGAAEIEMEPLLPFLLSHPETEKILSSIKQAGGLLHLENLTLSGPVLDPGKWVYTIQGSAENLHLSRNLRETPVQNLSGRYLISNSTIILTDLSATLNHLSRLEPLIGKQTIAGILTPLQLEKGELRIDTDSSAFRGRLVFPGDRQIDVLADGVHPGSLLLKQIRVRDPGFSDATLIFSYGTDKKISYDFNGILDTRTFSGIFTPDSRAMATLNRYTDGQSVLIHTDQDKVIHVRTHHLNLNSFILGERFGPLNELPDFTTQISFKTDALEIKNLIFSDVDTNLAFEPDGVSVHLNHALLCDLTTSGKMNIERHGLVARIPFDTGDRDNVQNLLSCLLKKNDFMDGPYSLKGEITIDAPLDRLSKNINGFLFFSARKGRVYKLTLLSRILSVLNVSSFLKGRIPDVTQKGFSYSLITIEADIRDSIIYLNRAVIEGTDMTLLFSGTLDVPNDSMNLTCLVAPFKTIDLIVEKIPLVNTVVSGNLISMPLKVHGKITDPLVIPLHPSAVGQGLVNIMTGILKAPVKLLDKLTDDEQTDKALDDPIQNH